MFVRCVERILGSSLGLLRFSGRFGLLVRHSWLSCQLSLIKQFDYLLWVVHHEDCLLVLNSKACGKQGQTPERETQRPSR
jgi:hypothetical protein